MVKFTLTAQLLGAFGVALFMSCSNSASYAGWTAPVCFASYVAGGLSLVLGVITDAHGMRRTGRTGDELRSEPKWFKLHDDGFLEAYDHKLGELYNANETHIILDMKRGHKHEVSAGKNNNLRVKTDLTYGRKHRRQAESQITKLRKRRSALARLLSGRQDSADSEELTGVVYSASKIASVSDGAVSSANVNSMGQNLANDMYSMGTYCATVSASGTGIADIGITVSGSEYTPNSDQAPCQAGSKKKKRSVQAKRMINARK